MATGHRPNVRLRALLTETGWTGQQLAGAVNDLGVEAGVTLGYGRAAVAHWLAGMRPRPPVPDLVAEALSRRLGRPLTAAAIGLARPEREPRAPAGADAGGATWWEADALAGLVELHAGPRPGRRRVLEECVYNLAALSVPGWADATVAAVTVGGGRDPAPRIGAPQVEAAAAMAQVFSYTDTAFGGGQARRALSGYLAVDVVPWLRCRMSSATRHRMLSIAAELTYLCGFMCFDEQLHGAAQRYYQAALRLAAENGDAVGYAVTLRALSVQAYTLGHHRHALDLAEAALSGVPAGIEPGTRAFLHGQAAVAAAASRSERRAALTHLRAAEHHLDHAAATTGTGAETVGAYHQASLAHQHAAVLTALEDRPAAVEALTTSIRHRPATERRARALTSATLAVLYLDQGHLEQAAATWHTFLDDYPHLSSGRTRAALVTLKARLRPHQRNTLARGVLQRAAAM
ncbi:hypothetical protein [Streptosporangium minutum]|uniref:Transcriptional regulator n=1 Tax=Streptosporangium minutum TaxID=569862 RepID=A0A243RF68_9ACTN|nr:hypothetical protein [Streptosporangium minutum]OUC93372.1 hypothetical protein CA984_26620 [Streptosporangium minutum]